MAKRRAHDDDDDDVGFRTPSKRDDERSSRRKETGRARRRDAGDAEPPRQKDSNRDTGKDTGRTRRREEAAPARKPPAPAPATPAGSRKLLPLVAALAAAGVVGAGMLALLAREPTTPPLETTLITDASTTPSGSSQVEPQPVQPVEQVAPPSETVAAPPPTTDTAPAEVEAPEAPPTDALAALAARSATHAAVARVLEELEGLFDPNELRDPGPGFQNFLERRRREEELLQRVRAMGPLAVEALSDMLVGLDHRKFRLFLGKALAGIEGPDALAAVGDVLAQVKDVSLQTTLVRYLPQTAEAADLVGQAFQDEEDPNLRGLLMREYADRLGGDATRGGELFRDAAMNDPNPNVRAEAITILGQRGDPADQQLLEGVIRNEQNLAIRQRAIDAYGATGKQASLPFLETLLRDPDSSQNVRASAVLAIGKVGGDQALRTLDLLAQTDPDPEIRKRAERLARSLRRAQQENPEDRVADPPPIRVGPGSPLERR